MSDGMQVDMIVYPYLRQVHVHQLVQALFVRDGCAVPILRHERDVLALPRELCAGDHIGRQPVVLHHRHARIFQACGEHTSYPHRIVYGAGGQQRAAFSLSPVIRAEEGDRGIEMFHGKGDEMKIHVLLLRKICVCFYMYVFYHKFSN